MIENISWWQRLKWFIRSMIIRIDGGEYDEGVSDAAKIILDEMTKIERKDKNHEHRK